MFFSIKNNKYQSTDQLRTNTMLNAYFVVKSYPMHASDLILNQYIQQRYDTTLKNICVLLLLNLSFSADDEGNLILMFKNPEYDKIAQLITYGNGAIPGSKILKTALSD